MNQNEMIYPMSLNYRNEWNDWEAIREIVQNMMDSNSKFSIKQTDTGLLLKDNGTGIRKKHLLLGVSEKEEGARGKFGEGLKLALVVLKRLGYGITIRTKNLKIKVDTSKIEGETCLKLKFDEKPNDMIGTEIFIEGYHGETFNLLENSGSVRIQPPAGVGNSLIPNPLAILIWGFLDLPWIENSFSLSTQPFSSGIVFFKSLADKGLKICLSNLASFSINFNVSFL